MKVISIIVYLLIGVGFSVPMQTRHPDVNLTVSTLAWPIAVGYLLAREVVEE